MFWIFKIFPDWIWWLALVAGICGFCLSYLPLAKPYKFVIKNISLVVVALTIFVCGMLYADNTWKAAAAKLEARVAELQAQAQAVNTTIQERVVTKIQVVKVRSEDTTRYIDREVTKHDNGCVIPPEFVNAHNRAAEQPK